jgi:simple sugar transport system ATP-binding protein
LILGAHRDAPYCNGRWFDWKSIYQATDRMIDEYHIQASGPMDIGGNLSGGNIQRVLIARALARQAQLLIAHNPTHGLDIPSTEFVYRKLLERKKQNAATLLVSEDLDELLLLCDRIGVMFRGELVGILNRNEFDKYQIGKLMAGVK